MIHGMPLILLCILDITGRAWVVFDKDSSPKSPAEAYFSGKTISGSFLSWQVAA